MAKKNAEKKVKVLKYPAIQNKLYTVDHVHDLIERAIHARKYRDQWEGESAYSSGADAHFQLKAYVELLENIVVFNIGDGANGFRQGGHAGVGSNLSDRLDSFIKAFHYGLKDSRAVEIIKAFEKWKRESHTVWVASIMDPEKCIGYVEAIEGNTVTIGTSHSDPFIERNINMLTLHHVPKSRKSALKDAI